MNCVLCARRGRTREVENGHVCTACRNGLRVDLAQILYLVALASTKPDPFASRVSAGGGRPHPASRPPLDLSHIGPHLALVRLDRDDPSSDTPLLVVIEDWCRIVREERELVPYGIATASRAGRWPDKMVSRVESDYVTLSGAVGFLSASVDWMCDEPTFGLDQLRDNVSRCIGVLRALDPMRERHDGWGIPCLGDADDEGTPCGRRLVINRHDDGRLDEHSDLHCPDCGTVWTAQRLLLVALADDRVTVWGYPEAITAALGIPRTTLIRWAERGIIGRMGNRYDAGAAFRQRHAATEARA